MSFFRNSTTRVVEILPQVMAYLFYIVNIMGVYVPAMQGGIASVTMEFDMCWTQLVRSPHNKKIRKLFHLNYYDII